MLDICKKEKVEALFNLGDTFETQEAVKTKFFSAFYEFCKKVELPHYIIVGNHDCPQKANTKINAVAPFGEVSNTQVIDELTSVDLKDTRFVMQPYTDTIDQEAMQKVLSTKHENVLLAHVSVQGAKMNSTKRATTGVKLDFGSFKSCYFGHFHTRQKVADNAWYIGALTQQNWSLAGNPTGFGIYDTETGEIEFHDTGSVKHIELTNDNLDSDIEGHCVKLSLTDKFSLALRDKIIQDLKDRGALDVKLNFSVDAKEDDRIEKLEDQINTTGYYMEKVIENSETDLDKDWLLELGLGCLQQAGQVYAE